MVWQAIIRNKNGKAAEDNALSFLQKQGLFLLKRNFAFSGGEIDLIMQDESTIVFCEVRYRRSLKFGGAIASITHKKRINLTRTATYYLQKYKLLNNIKCRFDVLAVQPCNTNRKDSELSIQWIKNAFDV